MRGQCIRYWALALGLGAAPLAANGADVTPPPTEPLPDAFYISPSVGVMNFDLPDIKANAVAVDGGTRDNIDIRPDFNRLAPVVGGSFGARLGDFGQSTVRLRGSGFYAWVNSDDTVDFDEFGALVWKGLTEGGPGITQSTSAAATLGTNPPQAASIGNSTGATQDVQIQVIQTGTTPPSATTALTQFNEAGATYITAGNLDALGLAIHYDEDLAYWGGELALAFDNGPAESGVTFTPFFGPIVRGMDRDLKTSLTDNSGINLSLRESLDARYYGAVLGVDMIVPMYHGAAVDLSVSAAPLYLDADYDGEESNSFENTAIQGPKIDDSDNRLAGLLRAQAGLNLPVFGHSWIRIGGEVEYLTDAPTIERNIGVAALAATSHGAAAVLAESGGAQLAKLAFDDMFAYGFNASLTIPFGP